MGTRRTNNRDRIRKPSGIPTGTNGVRRVANAEPDHPANLETKTVAEGPPTRARIFPALMYLPQKDSAFRNAKIKALDDAYIDVHDFESLDQVHQALRSPLQRYCAVIIDESVLLEDPDFMAKAKVKLGRRARIILLYPYENRYGPTKLSDIVLGACEHGARLEVDRARADLLVAMVTKSPREYGEFMANIRSEAERELFLAENSLSTFVGKDQLLAAYEETIARVQRARAQRTSQANGGGPAVETRAELFPELFGQAQAPGFVARDAFVAPTRTPVELGGHVLLP